MRRGATAGSAALALPLAACAGNPSALDPAGPAARAIADLTWTFVGVCGVVWLLTVAAWFAALREGRRRAAVDAAPLARVPPGGDRVRHVVIGAALVVTAAILSLFVGLSFATDRTLLALQRAPAAHVTLTAHQWWWEVRYDDPVPARSFTTANELHLPLGETVQLELASADVIHTFWLPNIAEKRDIIPGRNATLWITATRPGRWLGRCSEFCGLQHAHMQLLALVEPRADFEAWRAAQAAPSRPPGTEAERHGQEVFVQGPCVLCHVIRGSPATGYSGVAPDLTHLKSRLTLAAGTLPNTKGHLGGWIADPQSQKPGAKMPVNLLAPADFQDLLTYLETLR